MTEGLWGSLGGPACPPPPLTTTARLAPAAAGMAARPSDPATACGSQSSHVIQLCPTPQVPRVLGLVPQGTTHSGVLKELVFGIILPEQELALTRHGAFHLDHHLMVFQAPLCQGRRTCVSRQGGAGQCGHRAQRQSLSSTHIQCHQHRRVPTARPSLTLGKGWGSPATGRGAVPARWGARPGMESLAWGATEGRWQTITHDLHTATLPCSCVWFPLPATWSLQGQQATSAHDSVFP